VPRVGKTAGTDPCPPAARVGSVAVALVAASRETEPDPIGVGRVARRSGGGNPAGLHRSGRGGGRTQHGT
jgi:hypothetical protein